MLDNKRLEYLTLNTAKKNLKQRLKRDFLLQEARFKVQGSGFEVQG